ncbi:hypothetical protein SRB17_83120 [Streptomyces sp. RB17]|nr:hypothetical protein [Streptomyces sp. RB17]
MRSRFQFVDDHRATYEVKRLCEVLELNRSSYYKWLSGRQARAARQHRDRVLAEKIREVHGESGGAYGSPRVTAELRQKGLPVNEKRVARVMRAFSITGASVCADASAPPSSTRPPRWFRTCSSGTSPPRNRAGNTWGTSPTPL